MRSLADNYQESHSNTHETIADLTFCALVVLVLFILGLVVEVSQRVKSDSAASKPVEVIKEAQVAQMSPEEIAELSLKMRQQQEAIRELEARLKANSKQVENSMAALAGEQRFTGAREPAAISVCYNYKSNLYYFVPSRLLEHADRRQSGESMVDFAGRKTSELVKMALNARKSRGFTLDEASKIYHAFTKYDQVVEKTDGYKVEVSEIEVYYHVLLSQYIAGDTSGDHRVEVESAIFQFSRNAGDYREGLYPQCDCRINMAAKEILLNGVTLSPTDFREILLSVSGRGILLDFEGYSGKPPTWLYDEVLMPSGYVSKTPKLPRA